MNRNGIERSIAQVTTLAGCLVLSLTLLIPHTASGIDWLKKGQDLLGAVGAQDPGLSELTDSEIGAGLKEALKVGSERVVSQLGQADGFNADPQIHIPLPDSFEKARSALNAIGMAGTLEDLELQLNRAAEQATPQAKQLFWDSIRQMSVDDVRKIYNGPDDAATRYFQEKMSPPLAEAMTPIVSDSIAQVGAVQTYDTIVDQYSSIPFVPDIKTDLTSYVVDKGMEGIFFYLAKEEAAIRQDPMKRSTELLQKVFGSK